MQAIITKYLSPTNFRGSRVKATAQAGSITIAWDDALNADQNHELAALELANRYGWLEHSMIAGSGALPDGRGYAYVLRRREEP